MALSTLTLLSVIAGFSAWHYLRRRYLLQLCTFFNICAGLYMAVGLSIARQKMTWLHESTFEQLEWMCVVAVVGFNVAYLIANFGSSMRSVRLSEYLPSHASILVVTAVGLAFEATAILMIGPIDFLFSSRLERMPVLRENVALFYMANLINICLPIVFARYLTFRKKDDLTLLKFLIIHNVLFSLYMMSRHDLMFTFLILAYYLERFRVVRPVALVGAATAAGALMFFYKTIMYNVFLGESYANPVDLGELINWIRHTLLILESSTANLPHDGYFLALKSMFILQPEQDSLSEWFIKEFYPERYDRYPGMGYGFSGLLEGYLANGLAGIAAHFAVVGLVFGLLERSPTPMRHFFIVFALAITYRLFRSETYNFVKMYTWYFVYPTLAILIFDKFLTKASIIRMQPGTDWKSRQGTVGRQP